MLTHWLSQPKGKISRMVDDTRILALHVLFAAGFGVSHDFLRGARYPAPGHQLSHCDALMTILYDLVTSIIISSKAAFFEKTQVVLGPRVRHILLAVKEFRQYMEEAIASEREILSTGQGTSKPNLMNTLIRTSDQAKAEGVQAAVRLTDDEIKGNIFIFNLAGHDTTVNTLAYAFALLSMYREIQDWVVEEIDQVIKDDTNPRYEEAYPRLKRVQAVMYETLRLYGPVPQIPRGILAPNTLQVTNPDPTSSSPTAAILVPANTEITLRVHAMHTNSANFPNPRVWDPKRWVFSSLGSTSSSSVLDNEHLIQPGHSFAPWASGPRICPGMKFAKVEFAAVLSTVLRRASVAPSVRGDTDVSEDVARQTVKALIRDSHICGPTLIMRRPKEVCIKVSAR